MYPPVAGMYHKIRAAENGLVILQVFKHIPAPGEIHTVWSALHDNLRATESQAA